MGDGLVIEVGDWVRFYSAGRLIIAQVNYLRPYSFSDNGFKYSTDSGECNFQDILEVRKPMNEAP